MTGGGPRSKIFGCGSDESHLQRRRYMRMISSYASENIAMKGELDAELQRGKTGRRGCILKRDRPTEYGEVRDFLLQVCGTDSTDWDRLLETNLTAQKIERDFTAAIQNGIH